MTDENTSIYLVSLTWNPVTERARFGYQSTSQGSARKGPRNEIEKGFNKIKEQVDKDAIIEEMKELGSGENQMSTFVGEIYVTEEELKKVKVFDEFEIREINVSGGVDDAVEESKKRRREEKERENRAWQRKRERIWGGDN